MQNWDNRYGKDFSESVGCFTGFCRTKHCFGGLILLSLVCRTFASEYEFEVEGAIKYEVLSLDGSVYVEQDDFFVVNVKDCKWYIKKIPKRFLKNGKEQPLAEYGIASSDSTNFYQLASFAGIVNAQQHKSDSFEGRIGPGTVPFGLSDPKYIVLWYAFGSGCYFSTLTNNLVNPPTILKSEDMYAKDFRVLANWELQDQVPFLPKIIAFDVPPTFQVKPAETNLQWHLTNCLFVVKEFTNQCGLVLPKAISVQYFGRNPLNHTEIIPTSRMQILASNFQDHVTIEHFRPEIPGSAVISDMRTIMSNTPFGVAVPSTRNWPGVEDSKKKASSRALAIALAAHRDESHITIARVILSAVIISPVLVLWAGFRRMKVKNKNEKTTIKQ